VSEKCQPCSQAFFVKREVEEGNEVRDAGGAIVTAPFQEGGTGLPAFLSMVGRCTSPIQLVDPELESAWFQPLSLNCLTCRLISRIASADCFSLL
jgi:hypothetical protein